MIPSFDIDIDRKGRTPEEFNARQERGEVRREHLQHLRDVVYDLLGML